MPQIFDYPNLIAALDAGKGMTTKGYTFLDRDQKEQFYSFEKLREEAMRRAAHFRQYGRGPISTMTTGMMVALPVCMSVSSSKASSMVPKPPGKRATPLASFTRKSLRVKKYLKVISLGSEAIQGLASCSKGSWMLSPKLRSAPAPISIDEFLKVQLRVATVLRAEAHPQADKLLVLHVDLGTDQRQIIAGIRQHYAPEQLVGRQIIVVANLAPRVMRGLESKGMLLAASNADRSAVAVLSPEQPVPAGWRVG